MLALRLQFLLYVRRHSSRPKKEPEHVGIAFLRSGIGPFGVFPVAHAVGRFRNGGKREAYPQVRPDELKECLVGFGLEPQRFVECVAHIQILRRTPRQQRNLNVRFARRRRRQGMAEVYRAVRGDSEEGHSDTFGAASGVVSKGGTFSDVLSTAFTAAFRLRVSFAFFAA